MVVAAAPLLASAPGVASEFQTRLRSIIDLFDAMQWAGQATSQGVSTGQRALAHGGVARVLWSRVSPGRSASMA